MELQRKPANCVCMSPSLVTSLLLLAIFALSVLTTSPAAWTFPTFFFAAATQSDVQRESGTRSSLHLNDISGLSLSQKNEEDFTDSYKDFRACNLFDGRWVVDGESKYPLYAPGSCPFVDESFSCVANGRPDSAYMKLRWLPSGCNLPTLEGKEMLEMLRGKRLVFVGDSLNRNMWQSLLCLLRDSLDDKKTVSEVLRTKEFFSVKFLDFNASVEYAKSPFLVQEGKWGNGRQTLRLDVMHSCSSEYRDADIIVFNTGHWWTHDKTSRGKNYYQEGNVVYPELKVKEAYYKALRTWAQWVDANILPNRTRVFFRGFSATHFKGGQWNSGGNCDGEVEPIVEDSHLAPYPQMVRILESVIGEMKTPVSYLNITRMTAYRKDGHPSSFRGLSVQKKALTKPQDCSHWCLPGVPDAWNEIFYAMLLIS